MILVPSFPPPAVEAGPNRLICLARDVDFPAGRAQKTFLNIKPGFAFDEAIPSLNVGRGAENGAVKVEIRATKAGGTKSKWYSFGTWSKEADWAPRESLKGQRDEDGNVSTDTFIAKGRPTSVDVRLTLTTRAGKPRPKLKHLSMVFSDTKAPRLPDQSIGTAMTIDVPTRAQGNYPRGGVLCSATSTSMLLWHYSKVLGRPEIDRDVPEVERHVWDKVYNGAGNWSFNAAYTGSFDGLLAYVSRLDTIGDLETLIAAGVPVACSVSFDMLRGRALSPGESGHLVLVVGFEADGTPVFNDPAFKTGVRKTYPRADFQKAWDYSDHVVYIYVPEGKAMPRDPKGLWSLSR